MVTGKDFYGGTVTDAIAEACQEFSTSQEGLNIEILETGSSGIFGLCRKKAHIRAAKKEKAVAPDKEAQSTIKSKAQKSAQKTSREESGSASGKQGAASQNDEIEGPEEQTGEKTSAGLKVPRDASRKSDGRKNGKKPVSQPGRRSEETLPPPEPPSDEILAEIREDVSAMLGLMGFPSTVTITLEDSTVSCHIRNDDEEELVGKEGRTLDSLQYLLRKMTARRLPERIILALDVGAYRERRAEELKELAMELAAQVREDGKTRAIPALNPSERRVVHMVLQDDNTIRSRSVGAGLFKKVLIYKPGRKNYARKGKGQKEQQTDCASDE